MDAYGELPYIEARMKSPEQSRTARLEARINPEVLAVVRRAAEIQGRSVSEFVISAAQEAANRAIFESEVIRTSVEGQRQIAELLMNPPAPAPALKKAFRQRRKLLGIG